MRAVWAIGLVVGFGCVGSKSVTCPSGLTCPADYICDDSRSRCIAPDQLAQCVNHGEGDACTFESLPGTCRTGVCEPSSCGDGILAPGEECDGADFGSATCASQGFYGETTGLACRSDCTIDTRGCVGACGDHIRNGPELCDDQDLGEANCITAGFYDRDGLKCSPYCTYDVSACTGKCGDKIKNGSELCDGADPAQSCFDLGFDAGTLTCSNACGFDFDGCARFGWQLELVNTNNTSWLAVGGSSPSEIWAVGNAGATLHFDGTQWIAGSAANATSQDLVSVSVIGPGDVWAVGSGGDVLHWGGTTWTKDTTAPSDASAVWAAASNDIWVATLGNGVKRSNGTMWTAVGNVTVTELFAIHGSSANDVWVTTRTGAALHWNGASWTPFSIDGLASSLNDMFVLDTNHAWVVGRREATGERLVARWDGTQWISQATSGPLTFTSITGSAANDLWACDEMGGTAHYDGFAWLPILSIGLCRVFSANAGDVVRVGSDGASHYMGQAYMSVTTPAMFGEPWQMWSTATDHIFVSAVGDGTVAHFDGNDWSTLTASTASINAFWGTDDDLWAIGYSGKPTHFDGTAWTESTISAGVWMFSMWGSGPSDVWASGFDGIVLHYDTGTGWSHRDIPGFPIGSRVTLSGSGPSDVWAFYPGGFYRWTGTAWTAIPLPPNAVPQAMVVVGPNQVIITSVGRAHHWNGTSWTERALPTLTESVIRLVATAPDDVFALTLSNLLHFDGTRWSLVRLPRIDVAMNPVVDLALAGKRIDLVFDQGQLHGLIRTQPWRCTLTEAGSCNDGVDNDCDGKLDSVDPECP